MAAAAAAAAVAAAAAEPRRRRGPRRPRALGHSAGANPRSLSGSEAWRSHRYGSLAAAVDLGSGRLK